MSLRACKGPRVGETRSSLNERIVFVVPCVEVEEFEVGDDEDAAAKYLQETRRKRADELVVALPKEKDRIILYK